MLEILSTNNFEYQRRPWSRRLPVIFRGTPCTVNVWTLYNEMKEIGKWRKLLKL